MNCLMNVPFDTVPKELIDQLNSCNFTYEEYIDSCEYLDLNPSYWNFALFDDGQLDMIAFVWGILDPLENLMFMIRGTVQPEFREIDGVHILEHICNAIREIARQFGATHAVSISDKPDIFTSKVDGKLVVSQSRVLEVKLNADLH